MDELLHGLAREGLIRIPEAGLTRWAAEAPTRGEVVAWLYQAACWVSRLRKAG